MSAQIASSKRASTGPEVPFAPAGSFISEMIFQARMMSLHAYETNTKERQQNRSVQKRPQEELLPVYRRHAVASSWVSSRRDRRCRLRDDASDHIFGRGARRAVQ